MVSPETSDLVENVCGDQKLPEEDISVVLDVVADVLMGFIHTDDVASELVEQIKVDPKIAAAIQQGLSQKIFTPLKQTLDLIYQPLDVPEIKTSIVPNPNAPKMFDVATPAPAAITTAVPVMPVPQTPQKRDLSAKGWSGIPPATAPTAIKIDVSKPPVPFANIPRPAAPITASAPQPPKAPSEPSPMMMGGTNFSSAPQRNPDFHLSKTGSGAQVEFGQAKPQEKIMPAMIEFSKPVQNTAGTATVPPVAPKAAIHYTNFVPQPFKTALTANSGTRNVTEITSNMPPAAPVLPVASAPAAVPLPKPPVAEASTIPTPPQPPRPAAASVPPTPQPSQPPKPPQVKVITKDFL